MTRERPVIGIRDSGVGGLTVARRIRQLLPHADLLYFADTAHVPYGERTPEEVRHYAHSITEFLIGKGAQLVVFACNTSSAYALETARERFATPLIGMIEPGAKAALAQQPKGPIGVLATQATVNSGVYTRSLQTLRPGAQCIEIACPEFVPMVEEERTYTMEAWCAAERYVTPLLEARSDTIILGCTHYPLLLSVLREVAPHIHYVDPAEAVAEEVAALVREEHLGQSNEQDSAAGNAVFYASGPSTGLEHWIERLLGLRSEDIVIADGPVFDLPVAVN